MKSRILFVLLSLLISSVSLHAAQKRVFSELSAMNNVESIYMGSSVMPIAMHNINLAGGSMLVTDIESMEVLTLEESQGIKAFVSKARQIIKNMSLETIVETSEDDEYNSVMIMLPPKEVDGSTYVEGMVVLSYDSEEAKLIYVKGMINLTMLMMTYSNSIN